MVVIGWIPFPRCGLYHHRHVPCRLGTASFWANSCCFDVVVGGRCYCPISVVLVFCSEPVGKLQSSCGMLHTTGCWCCSGCLQLWANSLVYRSGFVWCYFHGGDHAHYRSGDQNRESSCSRFIDDVVQLRANNGSCGHRYRI